MPDFNVENYGDYPDYVEKTRLAMQKCNIDNAAAVSILDNKKPLQ